MKKAALWVAFEGHLNNGMVMAADAFFEGDWPLNVQTMIMVKSNIKEMLDKQAAGIKAVDNKGQPVIGAPKLVVQNIKICAIAPAEAEVADAPAAPETATAAAPVDGEAQKA